MRDKFMFFENFKETADRLPDDLRLKFYDAMTDYVFKDKETDDVIISALITAFKPSLDKEDKRGGNHNPLGQNQHSEVKLGQIRSKEVKSGQTRSKEVNPLETETETETEAKEKDNLKVIQKEKKFSKPTLDDVKAYCKERGNNVDAERWFNYYESNGWKVGKNSMKDWRAAVRTWEKSEQSERPAVTVASDIHVWTPEEEHRYQRNVSLAEATKRMLEERTKARFGA